jgi:RNA polymerase subunit RPABC4/transcription elongation factor Spt4
VPADAGFCPKCGQSMAGALCPKCGAALEPGIKFCPKCGQATGM